MAKHIEAGVSAISVEGVSKQFGDFLAVDNVSFGVDAGETFGFPPWLDVSIWQTNEPSLVAAAPKGELCH